MAEATRDPGRVRSDPAWPAAAAYDDLPMTTPRRTVLLSREVALARIGQVVDAEDWRRDKRTGWLRVLRFMAEAVDPLDGAVVGCTAAQIAVATGTSSRTVSRLTAWAVGAGLLLVVEPWTTPPPFERREPASVPMYAFIA